MPFAEPSRLNSRKVVSMLTFLSALSHLVPHPRVGTFGDRGHRRLFAGRHSVWNGASSTCREAEPGGESEIRMSPGCAANQIGSLGVSEKSSNMNL
jgi:hypothetical protein